MDTNTAARILIDKLTPGSHIALDLDGTLDNAVFLGVSGEGDERTASFYSFDAATLRGYDWEAYRFNKRWTFGTSAQPLRVRALLTAPCETCGRPGAVPNRSAVDDRLALLCEPCHTNA